MQTEIETVETIYGTMECMKNGKWRYWDGGAYRIFREIPSDTPDTHQNIIRIIQNPLEMRDIFYHLSQLSGLASQQSKCSS